MHQMKAFQKASAHKLQKHIDESTIEVRNFNTQLPPLVRSARQNINKETKALNEEENWAY